MSKRRRAAPDIAKFGAAVLPVEVIALPPGAMSRLQAHLREVMEATQRRDCFIQGVAATLGVPNGWIFDYRTMAFRPERSGPAPDGNEK